MDATHLLTYPHPPLRTLQALVSEAKESALLPSLLEGLAARGVSKVGNLVLPWRWFGGRRGGGGEEQSKQPAAAGKLSDARK